MAGIYIWWLTVIIPIIGRSFIVRLTPAIASTPPIAASLMVWVWSSSEQEFVSVVNLMQQPKHIKIENHVDAAAAEGSE